MIEQLEVLYKVIEDYNKQLAELKPKVDGAKQTYLVALSEYSGMKARYDEILTKCQIADTLKCQLKRKVEKLPNEQAKLRKKIANKKATRKDKLIKLLLDEIKRRGL